MFSKEELEVYIDSWAERFVNTNLCPYLTSCIKKFQDAFPEELPLQKARLGRTPFTTMGVTKNYECNVQMMTFYIQSLHGSSKVIIFNFFWGSFQKLFYHCFPNFVVSSDFVCAKFGKGQRERWGVWFLRVSVVFLTPISKLLSFCNPLS